MAIFDAFRNGGGSWLIGTLSVGKPGSVAISKGVTDGDTVKVTLPGNQGLRFLGCDTPEKKIQFRGKAFLLLNDAKWQDYFKTVWNDAKWGAFKPPLPAHLKAHLKKRTKSNPALNQWRHALAATKALEAIVEGDRKALKKNIDGFRVFAAFSHEVLDRYARPLVFANTDVKEAAKRPKLTYNERMIANGHATPFFMWPNIEPFREMKVTEAALPPAKFRAAIANARRLQIARKAARKAREAKLGIYGKNPLQLHAFELRMLARRAAPDRWVIDISDKAKGGKLYPPDKYIDIPNPEDRLFIPPEYVALFREKGWN